jgi:hypothetical protein
MLGFSIPSTLKQFTQTLDKATAGQVKDWSVKTDARLAVKDVDRANWQSEFSHKQEQKALDRAQAYADRVPVTDAQKAVVTAHDLHLKTFIDQANK